MPLPRRRPPVELRARRLELHGRRVPDGRRRLLLVSGAHRRHDHQRRLQHRRARRSKARCSRIPAVAECGVVASPDAERGQIVKAFVVLRPGFTAGEAMTRELQDFVKREIAPYKYPRAIDYLESLPRTGHRQAAAREAAGAGRGKAARRRMSPNRFVTTRRVGFGQCDPAGFVFYPRFLDFVARGRGGLAARRARLAVRPLGARPALWVFRS